jgi:hypothetical protein
MGDTQDVYISNDDLIREGDWWVDTDDNSTNNGLDWILANNAPNCKKIILTTDIDLIDDGVQAIPNDFLVWFEKNPSCEWVEPNLNKLANVK